MAIRIIQVSDPHLIADSDAKYRGVCTRDNFAHMLAYIEASYGGFQHIVLTGDIAHDERFETYEALRKMLEPWLERCLLLVGNHDSPHSMRKVFGYCMGWSKHRMSFALSEGAWRIVGLDTHWSGHVAGKLGASQIKWLGEELAAYPDAPTVLFMHHPPILVGSRWIDELGLVDADLLRAEVEQHKQVKAVFCGHVHQESEGLLGAARVYTTPSTAIQFLPQAEQPMLDDALPGFRIINLCEGDIKTSVVRVGC